MANSLIRSNRISEDPRTISPKNKVKINDLSNKKKESKSINVNSVSFNTNLKISNHSRNKLQALTNLGYSASQKDAIDLIFSAYLETLTETEKKEIDLQISVLERKDARTKKT